MIFGISAFNYLLSAEFQLKSEGTVGGLPSSDRGEAGRVKVFSGRGGAGSKREIQLGASRGGEKFFLVGTRRGVKNLPRFGLWPENLSS